MNILKSLTLSSVLSCALCASASSADSTLRPVNSFYSLEAGSSHLTDTYLTPIKYSGWHVGFNYERTQAMKFSPENWVMQMKLSLGFDRDMNQVRNHTMIYGELDFSWGMMRRWKLPKGFSAGIGGSASATLGCLYLNRGGNNPASAKGAVTVNLTGYATWNGSIGRLPVTLRYQPVLPVTGAFFAPDYGELYYEIYLGNHSNLAHWAHWGNYFKMDNLLTADLHFGATHLRVGYRASFYSTDINHTITNIVSHSAIIGVGGEWLSYKPGSKLSKEAAIISATY